MSDRRQVPRYDYIGEAELFFPPDGPTVRIALNTLAVLGCRGECKNAPAKKQKCELRLHWEGKEFQAKAEIIWRNPNGEIGLRFMALDEPHVKMLRNLCSELRVQPLTVVPQEPDKIRY